MDVDVYSQGYSKTSYEELQNRRPDYTLAIDKVLTIAQNYTSNLSLISLVDFCCGTGNVSKKFCKQQEVENVLLIDINKKLLHSAQKSLIQAHSIKIQNTDILKAKFKNKSNLLFSIFAYHHISNQQKNKYVQQMYHALNNQGIVIFAEIYLPKKEDCHKYYKDVLKHIPKKSITPDLEHFLLQTANSSNFEFKVSQKFAHNQLESYFTLIKQFKIWPQDNSLPLSQGMFIEVWVK